MPSMAWGGLACVIGLLMVAGRADCFAPSMPSISIWPRGTSSPLSSRTSSLGLVASAPVARPLSDRARKFLEKIPGNPIKGFEAADRAWSNVRSDAFTMPPPKPAVVERPESSVLAGGKPDYDFVVCGGTLGIFVAAALQVRGWKVAVVEQGKLVGRTQEWNISRKELEMLAELGILTQEQLDAAIVTEYNPQRVGFTAGGKPYSLDTIRGVLNLGVDPLTLIELVRDKFVSLGGVLLEERGFTSATIYSDAVSLALTVRGGAPVGAMGAGGDAAFADDGGSARGEETVTGRVLLDAMGNFSPIMRQAREYKKPDGVCLVVGTCARGDWIDNTFGDLIYSFTPIMREKQYFWEAFPSTDKHGSGKESRTTYMFTYVDADSSRGSIAEMLDDYLDLLPRYSGAQGKSGEVPDVDSLEASRALCGLFPCYTDSPLPVKFDRVVQVGDTSGLQSPLSFGGFGSLLRHLGRITDGLSEALEADLTTKEDLDALQPYLPSLSTMWLFQKAMSVKPGRTVSDPDIINRVLSSNFATMEKLGSVVMMPFLQDVIQLRGLFSTIAGMSFFDPKLVPPLLLWVGPWPVVTWTAHFAALAAYSVLYSVASAIGPSAEAGMDARSKYYWRRKLDAWKFGSGNDY